MPAKMLKEFLDTHGVRYISIRHSPAYTAQEVAASAHIPGKELAKTTIVDIDGVLAMAVLSANDMLDFNRLREITGASTVVLATEAEFRARFPDCEIGAMPPLGNLYAMDVYVDEALAADGLIAFNAGPHEELVQLASADFAGLVRPTVGAFHLELVRIGV